MRTRPSPASSFRGAWWNVALAGLALASLALIAYVVTSTTVGYGDITPQTGLARLLATVLMLLGIGTVGVVASSVSTALLHQDAERDRPELVDALERLAVLRERGALTEEEFASAKRRVLG